MGTDAVAEVNLANYFARSDVDHDQIAAVRARLPDARVAVNGHVGGAAIRRRDHFVASVSALRDRGNLGARCGIDDAKTAVRFVGNEQDTSRATARRRCAHKR